MKRLGVAQEVTGSCHILSFNGHRVLLDCGLVQGSKKDARRNYAKKMLQLRDSQRVIPNPITIYSFILAKMNAG
ncbi:hypothetical protein [Psychromonas sp.]|uniref:hypothetical protein n=1 Tax=Psychromonas sp. TaxID=1884585 RepID=UPI0035671F43